MGVLGALLGVMEALEEVSGPSGRERGGGGEGKLEEKSGRVLAGTSQPCPCPQVAASAFSPP